MIWPVQSHILIQGPYSNTPTMFFTVGSTVLLMMTNHSLPQEQNSFHMGCHLPWRQALGASHSRRLINAAPLATRDGVDGKFLFSCSLTLALERTLQGGCIFPSNAIKPTSDFPARWRQREGGQVPWSQCQAARPALQTSSYLTPTQGGLVTETQGTGRPRSESLLIHTCHWCQTFPL